MKVQLAFQKACQHLDIPRKAQFRSWVNAALQADGFIAESVELCIRVVDEAESAHLNETFRQKKGPTNVLSFPQDREGCHVLLGDIALCAPLVASEAKEQQGEPFAHWAHLTIHGTLHLLGYDHETPQEALIMEQQEITILRQLGFENPYEEVIAHPVLDD